jgi:hypothetical protein
LDGAGEESLRWIPKIATLLGSTKAEVPSQATLVIEPEWLQPGVPAWTAGTEIHVVWPFAVSDGGYGFFVHELVHLFQHYRWPGWLVEGIADYVRFGFYDPDRIDYSSWPTADYREGYSATGAFLRQLEVDIEPDLVKRIHRELTTGTYPGFRPGSPPLKHTEIVDRWQAFKQSKLGDANFTGETREPMYARSGAAYQTQDGRFAIELTVDDVWTALEWMESSNGIEAFIPAEDVEVAVEGGAIHIWPTSSTRGDRDTVIVVQ